MRVTWEASDIRGGLRTKKPGTDITGDWIVGWSRVRGVGNTYCLISLADGMVAHEGSTAVELAALITDAGHVPHGTE